MRGLHSLDIVHFKTGDVEKCVNAVREASEALYADKVDVVRLDALEKRQKWSGTVDGD